jgi:hypothetical protein
MNSGGYKFYIKIIDPDEIYNFGAQIFPFRIIL